MKTNRRFGQDLRFYYNHPRQFRQRTFNLQNSSFRALHLGLIALLALLVATVACSSGSDRPTRRQPTRTRQPTRAARLLSMAQTQKVARVEPTRTTEPTATRLPTLTPIPTAADTPTRHNTPVVPGSPTPKIAAAQESHESVPATEQPTPLPSATNTRASNAALLVDAQCEPTVGGEVGLLGAGGWEGRAPESHPDLNLAVRGYREVDAFRGLVDYDGETDGNAPQLWGLFADRRTPEITHTYQVYDWDWGSNSHGDPIQDFDVTMVGLRFSEGETIYTPDFGHEIGEGYVALVLYADTHRITIKYTGEDNVIDGYTLHLEGLCVYSNLLNLYNERHAAGRGALPALRPGQAIGYSPGVEIGLAIRDRGAFLDPRSRKDWWQGR